MIALPWQDLFDSPKSHNQFPTCWDNLPENESSDRTKFYVRVLVMIMGPQNGGRSLKTSTTHLLATMMML